MKVILFALLVLAACIKADTTFADEITVDEYALIVKGLLEGLDVKHEMEKIIKCIDSVPPAVNVIIEIIQKFKNLDIHSIKELVELIVQMVGAVREIIEDVLPCANSVEEFKKLLEKFSNIDFSKVLENLTKNIFEIIGLIGKAKTALESKEYENFGKAIGGVLFDIFLKV